MNINEFFFLVFWYLTPLWCVFPIYFICNLNRKVHYPICFMFMWRLSYKYVFDILLFFLVFYVVRYVVMMLLYSLVIFNFQIFVVTRDKMSSKCGLYVQWPVFFSLRFYIFVLFTWTSLITLLVVDYRSIFK